MVTMGKKLKKWLEIIAMAVITGICLVQVLYAVVWAVRNGNNVQDFYDTAVYLDSALTLQSDGWRLIGYSLILKVFLPFGKSFSVALYLGQCAIGILCFTQVIRSFVKLFWGEQLSFLKALPVAVYIITIPIIWQMQFAVLPDALCLSFLLLLCSGLMECRGLKDKPAPQVWGMIAGSLFMLGILERHYFYGGCILIGANLLAQLIHFFKKENRKRSNYITALGLAVIIFIMPIVVVTLWNITPKSETYAAYSPEADLWKRFVYPNIVDDYPYYSEDIQNVFSENDVIEVSGRYEYYRDKLMPLIEEYGTDNAKTICLEMVKTGWMLHRNELIEKTVKEGISYALIPALMPKYMYNNANSLYGHNFSRMYEVCPKLTADYMHVGMNGFLVVCVLGILMSGVRVLADKHTCKAVIKAILYSIVSTCCITLPAMLFSFARFDYRIGLFSTFAWGICSVVVIMFPILSKKNEQ